MGFITGSNIRVLLSASALALFASLTVADASSFKVLYSFTGGSNGGYPMSLTRDSNGNLYGAEGQPAGYGSVFKLAPNGSLDIYYLLKGGEGASGVFVDSNGSLWVTVSGGGTGCGVIFEIRPTGREVLKHTFTGSPTDGCNPTATLITNQHGEFYGTSIGGGKYNGGSVFKLASDGSESLLHSFGLERGGNFPYAGLLMDGSGNLYGTDAGEGRKDSGTVFKIVPDGAETVLYTFKGPPRDGSVSDGTLITDQLGNFYGTLRDGGLAGCDSNEGCGAVYQLTPDGVETILHFFTGKHGDGGNPVGGLIADQADNFYGTTYYGGGGCSIDVYGCGMVFKFTPDGTETSLYSFSKKNGANGAFPISGVVADSSGNLYGTAYSGGAYGYGTVFKVTP
ncbi:MAG TPA: choice-of-anchor tandem repeat GloVer-containing protein [Rhizomicrobium sp.]|jgi:uncharacterized repeat protein (TIGR03803 family)|nr:choice-of-anchor tandem repeat GloVer-containing protein [Rhizomicrobium sp.]